MPFSKGRYCCGCIPIKTGIVLIIIFGILNKLSGFYGILSFDYEDRIATLGYIHSIVGIAVFTQALYALHTDNVKILRWFTMFFWFDCLVSIITTIWFAATWYVYTDHSLPGNSDDPAKQEEHDRAFLMESYISLSILVILRLVHIYFVFVVTRYYKNIMSKTNYSRVQTENIDLEDTSARDIHPKPAID